MFESETLCEILIKEISLSVEARSSLGLGVGLVHDCVTVLS